MADEQPPAPAPESAPAAPAPEAGAPPAEDWAGRAAKAEHDLALERAKRESAEATYRLLVTPQQGPPQQQGPMPLVRLPRDQAQRIAASLGGQWTEEVVQSH